PVAYVRFAGGVVAPAVDCTGGRRDGGRWLCGALSPPARWWGTRTGSRHRVWLFLLGTGRTDPDPSFDWRRAGLVGGRGQGELCHIPRVCALRGGHRGGLSGVDRARAVPILRRNR